MKRIRNVHRPLILLVLLFASCFVSGYQGVQNACGQNIISVNGNIYATCPGGFIDSNGACVPYAVPRCPVGYKLINGFCYLENQLPQQLCPNGYYLSNGLCYPTQSLPCVNNGPVTYPPIWTSPPTQEIPRPQEQQTTPSPQRPQEMLPPPEPVAEALARCPSGSVLYGDQCRKIMCSQGEYHRGRCLQPACPDGTVWRRRRCLPPQYLKTIVHINNKFINEAYDNTLNNPPQNINNVKYHWHQPNETLAVTQPTIPTTFGIRIEEPINTTEYPLYTTSFTPTTLRTTAPFTTTTARPDPVKACCNMLTPRICKRYGTKWVCFNHRYKICEPDVCQSSVVYLRAPEVYYESSLLVMPPDPPLNECSEYDCDKTDIVDCSGCARGERETCSSYCYQYMCPRDSCSFIDLKEYCRIHHGDHGCTRGDGCVWDWC